MSKRIDIQPATVKKPLAEHPLRVAAYCQVSTDHEEQLGSLENQMKFYTDYIRNQINWTHWSGADAKNLYAGFPDWKASEKQRTTCHVFGGRCS